MLSLTRSLAAFGRPLWLVVLTLASLAAHPSHAQVVDAGMTVVVRAADSGAPLAGALVSLRGLGIRGVTDRRGELTLSLPPGPHTVRAQYLGYGTSAVPVEVRTGEHARILVELPLEPIPLAELRVVTDRPALERNGFNQRRGAGLGTFVTREQISRMQPRLLSDVLRRAAGISLTPTEMGGRFRASVRGGQAAMGGCPIQYYIDGVMTAFFSVDYMPPDDVEGIEIYRGASTIPPAYNRGTASCGVILIWTRDR